MKVWYVVLSLILWHPETQTFDKQINSFAKKESAIEFICFDKEYHEAFYKLDEKDEVTQLPMPDCKKLFGENYLYDFEPRNKEIMSKGELLDIPARKDQFNF